MNVFQQRLNEVVYHLENGNINLGFRMLVDAVLDTQNVSNFDECIAIAAWQEKNETNQIDFVLKCKTLVSSLTSQNINIDSNPKILVSAKEITKQFSKNGFELGPVSLDIVAGQLIGLVGENGNGKTTLLRMIAKELSISDGEISFPFANKKLDDYSLRTKLTYIPQRTPKWFGKVKDNLKLTATHYGISANENEQWVLMLMIRFGLWKFRNHSWNELSSGYKMRFELARTFLRKPKLLLLDEPLANLDILSQQLILEDLKMLGKSLSNPLGIVLSSQQLYEVEKVSDEVIFLKNGKPSSFNNLKNKDENKNASLIVEIEIENTKEELMNALANFTINEMKLLGSNYYIELSNGTSKELLTNLANADIQIKYFRDITFSTRRFFNN
jgi:ABC-2 type transport system ATP-binding protein